MNTQELFDASLIGMIIMGDVIFLIELARSLIWGE